MANKVNLVCVNKLEIRNKELIGAELKTISQNCLKLQKTRNHSCLLLSNRSDWRKEDESRYLLPFVRGR